MYTQRHRPVMRVQFSNLNLQDFNQNYFYQIIYLKHFNQITKQYFLQFKAMSRFISIEFLNFWTPPGRTFYGCGSSSANDDRTKTYFSLLQ